MAENPVRVVILGAGYAGMLAATRLAGKVRPEMRRGQVAITLINESEVFVERLRLHQVAANQEVPRRPITDILRGTGVSFVKGRVVAIDLGARRVEAHTDAGSQKIGYDHLLYALGSTIERDNVPGVRAYACVLTPGGPNSALDLRERLLELNANGGGRVLVVGGGATGIEAAAEIAEAYPALRVSLVTEGAFGGFMPQRVADYMRGSLERLGVRVQDQTAVVEVRAGEVRTAGGEGLPFDACLWAGGFTAPPLAREAGLAVNERGQVWIDPYLRSVSHPAISAVGDAAAPVETPGFPVRMSAFTAVLMGAHGADCLAAALRGRAPRPFSFVYYGQAIALGRRDAIGFNLFPNDAPKSPYFTGKTGFEIREFFVRFLAGLPGIERRLPGVFVWLRAGRDDARRWASRSPAPQRPPAALRRRPGIE